MMLLVQSAMVIGDAHPRVDWNHGRDLPLQRVGIPQTNRSQGSAGSLTAFRRHSRHTRYEGKSLGMIVSSR